MTEIKEVPVEEQMLRELRFGWSDEMPNERISSTSEDSKHKVRKGWFSHVIYACWLLSDAERITTEEGKKAAKELMERFSTKEIREQKDTKKEDIDEANRLIDIVLSGLKT